MYILGLNAYHGDASSCIYKDGVLIAATEEERIVRQKHWAGLPIEAIKFCLKEAHIKLTDVDIITVSRDPKAKLNKKIWHATKKLVSIKALINRGTNSLKISSIKKDICEALDMDLSSVKAEIKFIEHHRSHMASAFHISPFEESAILSIDGMGDFTSTMWGVGNGTQIDVEGSISYPHSLGIFYTMLTQYLGFMNYGDEYKVMGLAPYGKPIYHNVILNEIILQQKKGRFELNEKYFRHFKEGVSMSWEEGRPVIEPIFTDEIESLFGPKRSPSTQLSADHFNLAASVQSVTETIIIDMAQHLHEKTGSKNLCLAGGVAQNSVANGKIVSETGFERLFVPPAGHDAGTATGSALYYFHHVLKKQRLSYRAQPYTGAIFSNDDIIKFLSDNNVDFIKYQERDLINLVADALADGKVIGWFQGRAEFGPRALGNRSILMDPRRDDAKQILNQKIKKRESFRPFAPSILKEYVSDYFEQSDDVPFMEKVFLIREVKRAIIPAVTHVNGTGRLQTVDKTVNPKYHQLISAFYKITNVPILLNTSFNENEPIVNTPEHALNCYLRTKMDMLVLGDCVISRI